MYFNIHEMFVEVFKYLNQVKCIISSNIEIAQDTKINIQTYKVQVQIIYLFFMSSPNIDDILRQLQSPILQSFAQRSVEQQISSEQSFQSLQYFAPRLLLDQKLNSALSLQEIIESNRIQKSSQINQIYSLIKRKMFVTKYPIRQQMGSNQNSNNNQLIQKYQCLKSQTFHRLYLPESSFNEEFAMSKKGFNLDNLLQLAKQLRQILNIVQPLVNKIQAKQWHLKIQGLYLLHQIANLLHQIKQAAYPFVSEEHIIEILRIEIKMVSMERSRLNTINSQQNNLRLNDLKNINRFQPFITKQDQYLSLAIRIIRQKLSSQNQKTFIQLDFTGNSLQSYTAEQLKYLQLMLQIQVYSSQEYDLQKPIPQIMPYINNVISNDPLLRYRNQELALLQKQFVKNQFDFDKYYILHYKIIQKILQVKNVNSRDNSKEVFTKFVQILTKSLTIAKHNSDKQMIQYQNYIQFVKIINRQKLVYLKIDLPKFNQTFANYMQFVSKKMQKELYKIQMQMLRIDQKFTQKLLTNSKILEHLGLYQNQFDSSIKQIIPILRMINQVTSIRQNLQSKQNCLFYLIQHFHYLSLLNQYSFTSLQKKQRRKKSSNIMEQIQQICNNNPSLQQQIPHLLEVKNILILLQVLKTYKRKTKNNQQNGYIDFKYLQQLALYFSYDRECSIYQLKSKILLYITLFKMGHYIPKIAQNGGIVNLRQRIVNLMTRQARGGYSRVNLPASVILRSNLASSILVYKNQETIIDKVSTIMSKGEDMSLIIKASEQLKATIGEFIADLHKKYDQNWITFITERMNVMEHELFMEERNAIKMEENYLADQYIQHIKTSLSQVQANNIANGQYFQTFIKIQRYFFQEKYEKGWELMHKQKDRSQSFDRFINQILAAQNNQISIFRFLKIYKNFDKIQMLISPFSDANCQQPKNEEITKVVDIINQNSVFAIHKEPIIALILVRSRYKKIRQLQNSLNQISSSKKNQIQNSQPPKIIEKQPQIKDHYPLKLTDHRLSKYTDIRIFAKDEKLLQINLGRIYSNFFKQIQQKLKFFAKVRHPGIDHIKNIICQQGQRLAIQIQANSLDIDNFRVISDNNLNFQEKTTVIIIDRTVQIMRILLLGQNSINFAYDERNQVKIDQNKRTLSLNPYFIIIQKVLDQNCKLGRLTESFQRITNRFRSSFRHSFLYDYQTLIESLKQQNSYSLQNLSCIFNSSLFMNLSQKAQVIIKFQAEMSAIYRQFNVLARLPRDEKYLQNKRVQLLTDLTIKNYTYYFKLGGIVEQQAISQNICKLYDKGSRAAKFIWFDQRKPNDDLFDLSGVALKSDTKYSFQQFIRILKKTLNQSKQQERTMAKIVQRYPKLINFLNKHFSKLQQTYDKSILSKNIWVYTTFGNQQTQRQIIKQLNGNNLVQVQKILQYQGQFKSNLYNKADKLFNQYNCLKCKAFFKILKQIPKCPFTLIQFLIVVSKILPRNTLGKITNTGILAQQHESQKCFIAQAMSRHPGFTIFGKQMRKPRPRYYLIINWWFYLQYTYPSLIEAGSKIFQKIQQNK